MYFTALIFFFLDLFDSLPGDSWVLPERATKYFANLISDAIKANSRNAASSEVRPA